MVHIFPFMPASLVFKIVNPFSWIFNAISSDKRCLISTWRQDDCQDTRNFPAYWILIGQFKFPARQPYARCILTEKELFNVHSLLHLADGIKNLGPLWTHSCFPTESYNGNLLKIFHRTQNVALQIISALAISQSLPNLKSELIPGSVEEEFLYSHESISWQ